MAEQTAVREQDLAGTRVAFLVGAGRSGTTLLYKLLCLHPEIAYISNYDSRFHWLPDGLASRAVADRIDDKLRTWFGSGGNAYFANRPWLKKVFPTPHEGESVFAACGLPLVPAQDYVPDAATSQRIQRKFERIRRRSGGQIFLAKRTANNRRIRLLEAIFPGARYVHLIRDGREVAHSLSAVSWWDRHTVWWDGRTPLEMEGAGEPRLAICARNWVREMTALREQLASIERGRLLQVRFEDLLHDPLPQLERIVSFLGLEFTNQYRSAIESLALRPGSGKWRREWSPGELACVLDELQPTLRQYGYAE